MVSIDRNAGPSAMRKILFEIKKRFDDGRSIIIFPEGTRKRPGDKPNYKTGFVGIYNEVNRKILPVAVNSGLYWPKHTIFMKRGHIIIDIQECVETNLNKDEVFNKVVETIETATNKIIS